MWVLENRKIFPREGRRERERKPENERERVEGGRQGGGCVFRERQRERQRDGERDGGGGK